MNDITRKSLWFIFLFILTSNANEHPPGHLQPLGSHQPPVGDVASVDVVPSPEEFFVKYVQPGKPVLFKGAGTKSPAFSLWTDNYLRSKYGDIQVDVEEGKKEDRSKELFHMSLDKFLKIYNKSDVYLVQSLPKVMRHEVFLLKCLLCGGYTDSIQDSVLWFSNGGTNSVLHFDAIDNINCLMSGYKELFLVDKREKAHIDIDSTGAFSKVDVDRVDLYKYPGLADVPWYRGQMEPGDCLFIPYRWFHQVRSSGPRNLAINIWFSHRNTFNNTDCKNSPFKEKEFAPLSAFNVTWNYGENYGIMIADEMNDEPVDETKWVEIIENAWLKMYNMSHDVKVKVVHAVRGLFHVVDTNKDLLVSPREVLDASFSEFEKQLNEVLPDPGNEREDEDEDEDENGNENEAIGKGKDMHVGNGQENEDESERDSFETEIKHDDL